MGLYHAMVETKPITSRAIHLLITSKHVSEPVSFVSFCLIPIMECYTTILACFTQRIIYAEVAVDGVVFNLGWAVHYRMAVTRLAWFVPL